LYWEYIVTFTKVLTIYHNWIHPLHHSPLSPLPIPGIDEVILCNFFFFFLNFWIGQVLENKWIALIWFGKLCHFPFITIIFHSMTFILYLKCVSITFIICLVNYSDEFLYKPFRHQRSKPAQ
jgi:hypothetical protein